jgi:hypothetical protein
MAINGLWLCRNKRRQIRRSAEAKESNRSGMLFEA